MRLGQLARKLDIKPTHITSFLSKKHSIIVDDNLNTKIEDDVLKLVLDEFKMPEPPVAKKKPIKKNIESPVQNDSEISIIEEVETKKEVDTNELTEEEIETQVIQEVAEEVFVDQIMDEAIDQIVIDELETVKENISDDSNNTVVIEEPILSIQKEVPTPEKNSTEDIKTETGDEKLIAYDEDGEPIELNVVDGIIKAPKKELEGFKVIGKIDLPTKSKALTFIITNNGVSKDITETIENTRKELIVKRREQYLARVEKRKNKSNEKRKNSKKGFSQMELREKENKLAVEKRIQQQKAKKELKKKHYQQNVAPNSSKPKKKKTKGNKSGLKDMKTYDKEPTTRWGKIWKWFNT